MKSEYGSQISVNFVDIDMDEWDPNYYCSYEYVMLRENNPRQFSLLNGMFGVKFCGQQLPNYPGPSVLLSSKWQRFLSIPETSFKVQMSWRCHFGPAAAGKVEDSRR